jgi:hypothetical protein
MSGSGMWQKASQFRGNGSWPEESRLKGKHMQKRLKLQEMKRCRNAADHNYQLLFVRKLVVWPAAGQ